jgi:hypothetical protein
MGTTTTLEEIVGVLGDAVIPGFSIPTSAIFEGV